MKSSSVLAWIGPVFLVLLLAPLVRGQQSSTWIDLYNRLLSKYVSDRGVRYAAWKSNPAEMKGIQEVVDGIASQKVSSLNKKEQLAFYLNAYNAWILHEALAKYPTKSVKDLLFTFFLSKRIKVAGEQMSFNDLEKNIIRKKFSEPRVHFALNCASQSCPPLNREAFRGDQLDAQLEKLAVGFVNSPRGVDYKAGQKSAALSAIFNWYKEDFKAAGGPLAFINQRRKPPLPNDIKITYQDYDWGLNEVK
ncbi:MAG TPA: DUF547 domain-containing protein [Chthoniobacterales bacterium]|jgi:hypothetical protein|nr:DUF547 domain-containing protein [Chthoniobacterales bacterium]